jgi:hypothetical protein
MKEKHFMILTPDWRDVPVQPEFLLEVKQGHVVHRPGTAETFKVKQAKIEKRICDRNKIFSCSWVFTAF